MKKSVLSEQYNASQNNNNDRNVETAVGIHVGGKEIGTSVMTP